LPACKVLGFARPTPPGSLHAGFFKGEPMKIYIVDDEECIRDSFQMHLEEIKGHQVETFEEPLFCDLYKGERCQCDTPCAELIFLDYRLPEMSGLDLVKRIWEKGCREMVPNIVIMTGDTTVIDHRDIEHFGCRLEQKPLTLHTVDRIIIDAEDRLELNRNMAKYIYRRQVIEPQRDHSPKEMNHGEKSHNS